MEQMLGNILAHQLFKSANLPKLQKQMIKGTISDLKYSERTIKKIFRESLPSKDKCMTITENTFHTKHSQNRFEREPCESHNSKDDKYPQET